MTRNIKAVAALSVVVASIGALFVFRSQTRPRWTPTGPTQEQFANDYSSRLNGVTSSRPTANDDSENGGPAMSTEDEATTTEKNLELLRQRREEVLYSVVLIANNGEPSVERVEELFSNEDVPVLLSMLMSEMDRPLWAIIVNIVPLLEREEHVVPTYVDYIKRPDSYKLEEQHLLLGKIRAIAWLGVFDGEEATELLKQCVTKDGARETAREWIDNPLPDPYNRDYDIVAQLQISASKGLLYTRDSANIRLVEDLHADLEPQMKAIYATMDANVRLSRREWNTRNLFVNISEVLISRDLIERIGWEAYNPLISNSIKLWSHFTDEDLEKYGVRVPK